MPPHGHMSSHDAPIFYDPSGRRRRRFALGVAAFAALILLAVILFVVSIGIVPAQPLLPFSAERAGRKLEPPRDTVLKSTKRTIDYYARRLTGETRSKTAKGAGNVPLAIAFHVPWDAQSAESLRRHTHTRKSVCDISNLVTIANKVDSIDYYIIVN